ncbi:MAG: FG-GAP repeat protein [Cyanobacteriota bacterium]|jgi:hypothetical protein
MQGELFSDLVRGITPSAAELSRIQSENDQAVITLDGQQVAIEQAFSTAFKVNITAGTTPVEGGTVGTYTITLDAPAPTGGLVVNFNTTGSTATLTTDYTLAAGSNITNLTANGFTITAGSTTATLNLTAVADAVNDPGETVQINLASGSDYILCQNSTALFSPKTDYTVGTAPYAVAVGDFNGDGKLDFATANYGSSNVSVRLRSPNIAVSALARDN